MSGTDDDHDAASPRWLHRSFEIGVILKGLDALLEVFGGAALVVVSPKTLSGWVRSVTVRELDVNRFTGRHLLRYAAQLGHSHPSFAAAYLFSHGVAKLVVVVAVLRGRRWAYPGLIAVLGAFVVYQCVVLFERFSAALVALTVFDLVIIWLTWREWQARGGRTPLCQRPPTESPRHVGR